MKSAQTFHIASFADSFDEQKRAITAMETLEIGEKHYEVLRDHPEIYRDLLAPGYLKKDRLPPERILPKDGMHLALESHEKHVLARFSPLLAAEEKEWVASQITLVRGMRGQYNAMQRNVLGLSPEF